MADINQLERIVLAHDRQIGMILSALQQTAEIQLNQSERMEKVLVGMDRLEVAQVETTEKLNALIDLVDRMIRERGENK